MRLYCKSRQSGRLSKVESINGKHVLILYIQVNVAWSLNVTCVKLGKKSRKCCLFIKLLNLLLALLCAVQIISVNL